MKVAPRVYVDSREYGSPVPERLARLGIIVVKKELDVGDYLVSENIVVERKTLDDLVRSVYDGRLFEQGRRLGETYSTPILLVEGDPSLIYSKTSRHKQVTAALLTISLDYGIIPVYTRDPGESAELIAWLAKRAQEERRERIVVRRKPRISGLAEWQLYLVQGLPYVGPRLAASLLRRFGTPQAVFNAGFSELSRVSGIGEKRATFILKVLRTPYESARRSGGRTATLF